MKERFESAPPNLPELFALLRRHRLRWVMSGSVAAMLHGVEVTPGDLDVVPAIDRPNLEALVELLEEIGGHPVAFGQWVTRDDGERVWLQEETTPARIEAWRPDPDDIDSLDHLFHSRLGNLDIVPTVTGTFDELRPRARRVSAHGIELAIAHIDELLAKMTRPRRPKDVARVAALRAIQRGS